MTASAGGISGTAAISSTASQSLAANAVLGISLTGNSTVQGVALSNSTSNNIAYTSSAGAGSTLTVTASNLAAAGSITITELSGILSVGASGIASNDGAVTLIADSMTIGNTVDAGTGRLTVRQYSNARAINLGTNGTTLDLVDTEVANLVSTTMIQIGDANSGTITVSAAVGNAARSYHLYSASGIAGAGNALSANGLAFSVTSGTSLSRPSR